VVDIIAKGKSVVFNEEYPDLRLNFINLCNKNQIPIRI
jgi:hypothetical protein